MHNFRKSLAVGKVGEELFAKLHPELEALNGKGADFRHKETGELWEIKSDSYDMKDTANFFIELMRNDKTQAPGGPAQALEHGSKYWVCFFPKNMVTFTFETARLVEWLKGPEVLRLPLKFIPNRGYNTVGVAVPREWLKDLYTRRDFT